MASIEACKEDGETSKPTPPLPLLPASGSSLRCPAGPGLAPEGTLPEPLTSSELPTECRQLVPLPFLGSCPSQERLHFVRSRLEAVSWAEIQTQLTPGEGLQAGP